MITGSLSPATYPSDSTTVRWDQCGRVGQYKHRKLIERYGADATMPDVLNEITARQRNQRLSVERCSACYVELRATHEA